MTAGAAAAGARRPGLWRPPVRPTARRAWPHGRRHPQSKAGHVGLRATKTAGNSPSQQRCRGGHAVHAAAAAHPLFGRHVPSPPAARSRTATAGCLPSALPARRSALPLKNKGGTAAPTAVACPPWLFLFRAAGSPRRTTTQEQEGYGSRPQLSRAPLGCSSSAQLARRSARPLTSTGGVAAAATTNVQPPEADLPDTTADPSGGPGRLPRALPHARPGRDIPVAEPPRGRARRDGAVAQQAGGGCGGAVRRDHGGARPLRPVGWPAPPAWGGGGEWRDQQWRPRCNRRTWPGSRDVGGGKKFP